MTCALLFPLRGILNNIAVDPPPGEQDPHAGGGLEAHDQDVPPVVLFWFGMHQLQKGGKGEARRGRSGREALSSTDTIPVHCSTKDQPALWYSAALILLSYPVRLNHMSPWSVCHTAVWSACLVWCAAVRCPQGGSRPLPARHPGNKQITAAALSASVRCVFFFSLLSSPLPRCVTPCLPLPLSLQRQDYPPHLLSLHKLGWMAETTRDLRGAERCVRASAAAFTAAVGVILGST